MYLILAHISPSPQFHSQITLTLSSVTSSKQERLKYFFRYIPYAVLIHVRAKVNIMPTDGPLMNGSVRYALKQRLHTFSSMFTTYLVALSKALEFASDLQPGHFHNTHRFSIYKGNFLPNLITQFLMRNKFDIISWNQTYVSSVKQHIECIHISNF